MADPVFPATPQAFRFRDLNLVGVVTGFSGRTRRRGVYHEYLKRSGQRVEDMARAPRNIEVRLEFLGPRAARDYADFAVAVDGDPRGLIVHPIFGRWNAFCEGPQEDVDYARAVDEIKVRVVFVEDQLGAVVARDAPDTGTAAQQATTQLTAMDKAVAAYMGVVAQADAFSGQAIAQIQSAMSLIDTFDDPIVSMRTAISTAYGVTSAAIGKISTIATQADVLEQEVNSYVDAATDVFNGSEQQAGQSSAVDLQLTTVAAQAAENFDYLVLVSPTPAGAAEAAGRVDEVLSACYVLAEALAAERPPTVIYVVPRRLDLMRIATNLYPDSDAYARASEILALNQIPNPGAIPAGVRLRVPSK